MGAENSSIISEMTLMTQFITKLKYYEKQYNMQCTQPWFHSQYLAKIMFLFPGSANIHTILFSLSLSDVAFN
jgi:hypothetical protein